MAKRLCKAIAAVAFIASVAACGGGDSGGGGGGGTDVNACGTTTQGCVTGNVVDAANNNAAIPNATLSIGGGAAINANAQGYFFSSGIEKGTNLSACFSATGYVTRCRNIDVMGGQVLSMTPTQLMPASADKTLNAVGGTINNKAAFTDPNAGGLTVVAGDLCDTNGNPVAGNVVCNLSPIDVSQASGTANSRQLAFGNFRGTDLTSATQQLETGGMMDIVCKDGTGAKVNVCSGKTVTIDVPIYANCAAQPATMPSWGFNETTGLWEQKPAAYDFVKTCGTDATDSYYRGKADHFSPWNCDMPIQTTCLNGKVTSDGTTPVGGALVECTGTDYQGDSSTYSAADGTFCVPVKAGGAYSCIAKKGAFVATAATGVAPAAAAQCGGSGCGDLGTFTLTDPLMRTILTWGALPSDLDSHFVGAGVHVWYSDKDLLTKGSLTGAPFVELDTDDTDSFGPEITTVVPNVAAGTYTFCVHNFSGEAAGPIAASGAKVNVITSTAINKIWDVPTSNPSNFNVWRVYSVVLDPSNSDPAKKIVITEINDFVDAPGGNVESVCVPKA